MNIVLVEPEIPQNTGNIARTCAATGSTLHLVRPLGFSIEDKYLKRAGLDYWSLLDIRIYQNLDEFFERNRGGDYYFASTKSAKCYTEVNYRQDSYIFFGKETKGLPESLLLKYTDRAIRIPMIDPARSLNLSNSVAVIVYEALRQNGFEGLNGHSAYLEKLTDKQIGEMV